MIHFEEIEEKHIPFVKEIYNYYVKNTTVSFDIDAASIDKMRELTLHTDKRFCSYVICNDNIVIGYILLSPFIKKHSAYRTAEVTIYLDPGYKGNGIGSAALEHIEHVAKHRGFHNLLAVICTENSASIRLFEKSGYTLKGIINDVGYKFDRYLDLAYMSKLI